MAPVAVDAADLCLGAGQRETLKIWPETQKQKQCGLKEEATIIMITSIYTTTSLQGE